MGINRKDAESIFGASKVSPCLTLSRLSIVVILTCAYENQIEMVDALRRPNCDLCLKPWESGAILLPNPPNETIQMQSTSDTVAALPLHIQRIWSESYAK